MNNNIIEIKNLCVDFTSQNEDDNSQNIYHVLTSIDLSIKEGEFLCILGKNGCGKSTFAKTINALITPTSGDVIVCNMNTKDEDKILDIRKNVGMSFQNPDNQIVASIVEEDIAFGLENIGIDSLEMRKRIDDAMMTLGISDLRYSQVSKLSGGQKQKVSLAGILAMKSRIMVLDEPTSMIDKKSRIELLDMVKKLNKEEGITVILISHFIEEIKYADRVLVMGNNRIIFDDTPKNILLKGKELENLGIELPYIRRLVNNLKNKSNLIKGDEDSASEICQYLK